MYDYKNMIDKKKCNENSILRPRPSLELLFRQSFPAADALDWLQTFSAYCRATFKRLAMQTAPAVSTRHAPHASMNLCSCPMLQLRFNEVGLGPVLAADVAEIAAILA